MRMVSLCVYATTSSRLTHDQKHPLKQVARQIYFFKLYGTVQYAIVFWKASPVPIKDWYDVGLVMGKLTTELWLKYHATCGLRNGGWVPLTCLAATPYGTVELLLQLIHFGYSNSEHVFFGPDATTISRNALLAYQSAKASLSGVTKALKSQGRGSS